MTLDLQEAAHFLLSKSEKDILDSAFSIPAEPGIYFLIADGEVVYVGQSRIPIRRIGDHARDKIFDSLAFLPCPMELLAKMERHFIDKFSPRYNDDTKGRIIIRGVDLIPTNLRIAAERVKPVSEKRK